MGLFDFFKSNKHKHSVNAEVVICSDTPYIVKEDIDCDGRQEFKTFTENWVMRTDHLRKNVNIPVKVTRNDCGIITLDLYLPDSVLTRILTRTDCLHISGSILAKQGFIQSTNV